MCSCFNSYLKALKHPIVCFSEGWLCKCLGQNPISRSPVSHLLSVIALSFGMWLSAGWNSHIAAKLSLLPAWLWASHCACKAGASTLSSRFILQLIPRQGGAWPSRRVWSAPILHLLVFWDCMEGNSGMCRPGLWPDSQTSGCQGAVRICCLGSGYRAPCVINPLYF